MPLTAKRQDRHLSTQHGTHREKYIFWDVADDEVLEHFTSIILAFALKPCPSLSLSQTLSHNFEHTH
jgi:hypothetical protein